eukprot:TRINITY_DN95898_c0_g1_i1.p1 TRINITY_DN95898_c0_g1~~TRINITY_DN95898_c0_g1_i1.p1  ORF type:complete len:337 (-),score=64.91 TRINITY_DN95898_c0_g1_i1:96-1016(-)
MSFAPQEGYVKEAPAPEVDENATLVPSKRYRMNVVPIVINCICPSLLFTLIMYTLGFNLRRSLGSAAYLTVVLGLGLTGMCASLAVRSRRQERDPMWYTFSTIMLFLATVTGATLGDMNYSANYGAFQDIESLSSYPNVNPALDKGQQMMDAGRVYFTEGSSIDQNKATSFTNLDKYCVAPIIFGDHQLASYDFWAVGVNCCKGGVGQKDFKCGEASNPAARSGLRLMRDDQRPFFRLAVQQAEAAYNIKSAHPLFFHWVQDPVGDSLKLRDAAIKYAAMGAGSFFAFNFVSVMVASILFSKIRIM